MHVLLQRLRKDFLSCLNACGFNTTIVLFYYTCIAAGISCHAALFYIYIYIYTPKFGIFHATCYVMENVVLQCYYYIKLSILSCYIKEDNIIAFD
jgi:hypothetical protein